MRQHLRLQLTDSRHSVGTTRRERSSPLKRPLLIVLAVVSANACCQSGAPAFIAGKAELLNPLKSATLKPGDLFYLRTAGAWQQGDCTIPAHTIITGHVESLTSTPPRNKDIILSIRFSEVSCSDRKSAFVMPLLISIRAPGPGEDRFDPGAPQTPVLSGIFPSQVRSDGRQINIPTSDTNGATRAFDAGELNQLPDTALHEKPMKTGEVRGYHGVALTLPGREGPAAKLSSGHKFLLDRHAEFAFAYAPAPPPAIASNPAAAMPGTLAGDPTPATAVPPPPPPPDMDDVCVSAGCRELAAIPETRSTRALWTLPLAALGYQSRPLEHIIGLDHSASVHFLGEDQILLTFTRHVLLPRSSGKDAWASNPRGVRAVLISRSDAHVIRIADWTVSDDLGPFVWALGDGAIIAHIGHDLVRLGPGLAIQRRFTLPGPLLFLSASPNGNLLLIATNHEKHSEKEHARIAALVGPGVQVDEDYDLTGLNSALQVTGSRRVSDEPLRPALLENSMITARLLHGSEWLVEQSTWEGASKLFAHARSVCPLQIQSFAGNLLLLEGCSPMEANTTWYRVLNANGATLFKGSGPRSDFIQQAESSNDGRLFAIASSHFVHRPVDRTSDLAIGDFTNLTVALYDTVTGKQFFAAHPAQGSAEEDTFSISPSGVYLAVLTSSSIQFFPLPAPATKK